MFFKEFFICLLFVLQPVIGMAAEEERKVELGLGPQEIIAMCKAGVDLSSVREFKAAAPKTTVQKIIEMSKAGVDLYAAREFKKAFPKTTVQEILDMSKAGVNLYIAVVFKAAAPKATVQKIIAMKIVGVDLSSAREFKAASPETTLQEIIAMDKAEVHLSNAAKFKGAFPEITVQDMIKMSKAGVNLYSAAEFKAVAPKATVQDMIKMSTAGVHLYSATEFKGEFPEITVQKIIAMKKARVHLYNAAKLKEAFPEITVKKIIAMNKARVDLDWAVEFKKVFPETTAQDIIEMSKVRVGLDWAVEFKKVFPETTVQDMIEMSKARVDLDWAAKLKEAFPEITVQEIIAMSKARVVLEWAVGLKEAFPEITIQEMIVMYKAGVKFHIAVHFKREVPKATVKEIIEMSKAGVLLCDTITFKAAAPETTVQEMIKMKKAGVNLLVAAQLKEKASETTVQDILKIKKFWKSLSDFIKFKQNYPGKTIKEIIKERQLGKKYVLVVYPKSDHNSTFQESGEVFRKVLTEFYDVVFVRASSFKEIEFKVEENFKLQKRIAHIIFAGHGSSSRLIFGKDSIQNDQKTKKFLSFLKERTVQKIDPTWKTSILLHSCNVGEKKEGLGLFVSKCFPQSLTYAPKVKVPQLSLFTQKVSKQTITYGMMNDELRVYQNDRRELDWILDPDMLSIKMNLYENDFQKEDLLQEEEVKKYLETFPSSSSSKSELEGIARGCLLFINNNSSYDAEIKEAVVQIIRETRARNVCREGSVQQIQNIAEKMMSPDNIKTSLVLSIKEELEICFSNFSSDRQFIKELYNSNKNKKQRDLFLLQDYLGKGGQVHFVSALFTLLNNQEAFLIKDPNRDAIYDDLLEGDGASLLKVRIQEFLRDQDFEEKMLKKINGLLKDERFNGEIFSLLMEEKDGYESLMKEEFNSETKEMQLFATPKLLSLLLKNYGLVK